MQPHILIYTVIYIIPHTDFLSIAFAKKIKSKCLLLPTFKKRLRVKKEK